MFQKETDFYVSVQIHCSEFSFNYYLLICNTAWKLEPQIGLPQKGLGLYHLTGGRNS